MAQLFSQFAGNGDLVFDVGANRGNRIDACLSLGTRVLAVEPQARCVRSLRRRFGSNPAVKIVPEALGAAKGEHDMWIASAHTISSMSDDWVKSARETGRFSEFKWKRKVTVPVNTMDALIETYGEPAFTKIDVEGFETEVLAGLTRPLRALSFEYAAGFHDHAIACVERLQQLGEYEFNYSVGESMDLGLEQWVSPVEIEKFLSSLPAEADWGDVYARLKTAS